MSSDPRLFLRAGWRISASSISSPDGAAQSSGAFAVAHWNSPQSSHVMTCW